MAKKLEPIDHIEELRKLDRWRTGNRQFYRDVARHRLGEFLIDDEKRAAILEALTQYSP